MWKQRLQALETERRMAAEGKLALQKEKERLECTIAERIGEGQAEKLVELQHRLDGAEHRAQQALERANRLEVERNMWMKGRNEEVCLVLPMPQVTIKLCIWKRQMSMQRMARVD